MSIVSEDAVTAQTDEINVDICEQLVNEGRCGLKDKDRISVKIDEVVQLNGILFDIDLCLLNADSGVISFGTSPDDFFERTVSIWLKRHPVLRKAEVRCSGRGLHVILRLDKPIQFRDEIDRARWVARVKVIQSALPIDPNQPGINAMTRKLGSVNGKNNAVVTLLKCGEGVTEAELLALVDEVLKKPFKLLANVLLGNDGYISCPFCNEHSLDVSDRVGRCYRCKRVSADQLLRLVYADTTKPAKVTGVTDAN